MHTPRFSLVLLTLGCASAVVILRLRRSPTGGAERRAERRRRRADKIGLWAYMTAVERRWPERERVRRASEAARALEEGNATVDGWLVPTLPERTGRSVPV